MTLRSGEEIASLEGDRRRSLQRPLNILICPDKPGWAFDNIAQSIKTHAPPDFSVNIAYMQDYHTDKASLIHRLISSNIDILHIFWREDMFAFLRPETILRSAVSLGSDWDDILEFLASLTLTTSVYDHLHMDRESIFQRLEGFHLIDGYSVSSAKLQQIYARMADIPNPDCCITDSVDTARFRPGQTDLLNREKLTLGWVGNSQWGKSVQADIKGYRRLFLPLIEKLNQNGLNVDSLVADPTHNYIPFGDMPEYYRKIDILVCTSAMEGTPNPVLEAMASGLPVISTDVGVVAEAFGSLQSQFIVHNPTPDAFAEMVTLLNSDASLRRSIAEENLLAIQDWDTAIKVKEWWNFWLKSKQQSSDRRTRFRRKMLMAANCNRYLSKQLESTASFNPWRLFNTNPR